MMKCLRRVAVAFTLLVATKAGARGLQIERMTIPAGNATLQGVRFLNSNGQPNTGKWVIFAHGLGSNYHEFEYLVPLFMAAGYDCYAFNFRGHGNGGERSVVSGYRNGDYRIEKLAGEDFPAVVREVQRFRGGSKGIVLAHSMGGMNSRGAFALGQVTEEQIESMILLGSPPHFDSHKASRDSLDFLGLLRFFDGYLDAGRGDLDVPLSIVDPGLESLIDLAGMFHIGFWFVKGTMTSLKGEIVRFLNETSLDVPNRWLLRAISERIPKDILRSFAGYTRGEKYPFKDVAIPVPILHITGERDALAGHADIAAHASVQSGDAGYWLAKVMGAGHMELVTPKAINAYQETMFEFLEAQGAFNSGHKSHFELTPSCAGRLVQRVKLTN